MTSGIKRGHGVAFAAEQVETSQAKKPELDPGVVQSGLFVLKIKPLLFGLTPHWDKQYSKKAYEDASAFFEGREVRCMPQAMRSAIDSLMVATYSRTLQPTMIGEDETIIKGAYAALVDAVQQIDPAIIEKDSKQLVDLKVEMQQLTIAAIKYNLIDVLKILKEKKYDIAAVVKQNKEEFKKIICALNNDTLKSLFDGGIRFDTLGLITADHYFLKAIDAQDSDFILKLKALSLPQKEDYVMYAARNGKFEIADVLIANGFAKPNHNYFRDAVAESNKRAAEHFLSKDSKIVDGKDVREDFQNAIFFGDKETVKMYLELGVKIPSDSYVFNDLLRAKDNLEANFQMAELLNQSKQPNRIAILNNNFLKLANSFKIGNKLTDKQMERNCKVMQQLMGFGADSNAIDKKGRNALHILIGSAELMHYTAPSLLRDKIDYIQFLLSLGVKSGVVDKSGKSFFAFTYRYLPQYLVDKMVKSFSEEDRKLNIDYLFAQLMVHESMNAQVSDARMLEAMKVKDLESAKRESRLIALKPNYNNVLYYLVNVVPILSEKAISYAIQKGGDINSRGEHGVPLLITVLNGKYPGHAAKLLEYKPNLTLLDRQNRGVFYYAIVACQSELVGQLLSMSSTPYYPTQQLDIFAGCLTLLVRGQLTVAYEYIEMFVDLKEQLPFLEEPVALSHYLPAESIPVAKELLLYRLPQLFSYDVRAELDEKEQKEIQGLDWYAELGKMCLSIDYSRHVLPRKPQTETRYSVTEFQAKLINLFNDIRNRAATTGAPPKKDTVKFNRFYDQLITKLKTVLYFMRQSTSHYDDDDSFCFLNALFEASFLCAGAWLGEIEMRYIFARQKDPSILNEIRYQLTKKRTMLFQTFASSLCHQEEDEIHYFNDLVQTFGVQFGIPDAANMTEHLNKLKDGDKAAFIKFFNKHYNSTEVVNHIQALIRNPENPKLFNRELFLKLMQEQLIGNWKEREYTIRALHIHVNFKFAVMSKAKCQESITFDWIWKTLLDFATNDEIPINIQPMQEDILKILQSAPLTEETLATIGKKVKEAVETTRKNDFLFELCSQETGLVKRPKILDLMVKLGELNKEITG